MEKLKNDTLTWEHRKRRRMALKEEKEMATMRDKREDKPHNQEPKPKRKEIEGQNTSEKGSNDVIPTKEKSIGLTESMSVS